MSKTRGKNKKTQSGSRSASDRTSHRRLHLPLYAAVLFFALTLFFFIDAARSANYDYAFPFIGLGGVFKYHYVALFSKRISLYWAMHGAGLVGMIALCLIRRKHFRISGVYAVVTALLLAVLGYVGAKLLYVAENWTHVAESGLTLNGVSFFGTVLFMPLVLPLIAKMTHKSSGAYLDYCTPAGLLMLTCIRTGCFLNGCCQGISVMINNNQVILPAQLLECTLDLILLELLFTAEKKLPQGKLYFLFMGGYGLLRFAVEFTRATPKTQLGLSNGQWFSLICILVSAIAFLIPSRKKSRHLA